MQKQLLALCCVCALFLANCQKEVTSKTSTDINGASVKNALIQTQFTVADSTAVWYGSYAGYYGPYPAVSESQLIHDGVAEEPFLNQPFSFSNVSLDIPPAYAISGDSIVFEVVVKNPRRGSLSDYDVVLQLIGDQHLAELHFVADESAQIYTQFYVGAVRIFDRPRLVQSFPEYKLVRLALRRDTAVASVNDSLVAGFKYGEENRIGRLKTINVAGKGYCIVNNIRLLNSKDYQPILSEDFNGDGQSHTIFY